MCKIRPQYLTMQVSKVDVMPFYHGNHEAYQSCYTADMQGSHWSRRNRMFVMHDSRPQQLTTLVSPSDIMAFGGEDPSARFVLYSDAQKMAWVTELREGIKISLKRAESDVVTVVPLRELKGLSVAPIGEILPIAADP